MNLVPILFSVFFGVMCFHTGNYLYGIGVLGSLVIDGIFYAKNRREGFFKINEKKKQEIIKEILERGDIPALKDQVFKINQNLVLGGIFRGDE